jgi:hypothetical protein
MVGAARCSSSECNQRNPEVRGHGTMACMFVKDMSRFSKRNFGAGLVAGSFRQRRLDRLFRLPTRFVHKSWERDKRLAGGRSTDNHAEKDLCMLDSPNCYHALSLIPHQNPRVLVAYSTVEFEETAKSDIEHPKTSVRT